MNWRLFGGEKEALSNFNVYPQDLAQHLGEYTLKRWLLGEQRNVQNTTHLHMTMIITVILLPIVDHSTNNGSISDRQVNLVKS